LFSLNSFFSQLNIQNLILLNFFSQTKISFLISIVIISVVVSIISLLILYYSLQLKNKLKLRTKLLIEKEKQYCEIAENLLDLVCRTNLYGNFEFVSNSFNEIVGYDPDELLTKKIFDFIHPDDLAKTKIIFENSNYFKFKQRFEFRFKLKSNRYIWLDGTCSTIVKENGIDKQIIIGCRDVSARKLTDELLWKQSQLQKNLLSSVPALVYLKDTEFRYIEVNDRMCELLGIEKVDIIGKTDYDLFPEDKADFYYKTDVNTISQNKTLHNIETSYMLSNENIIWLSSSKIPYYDIAGNVIGLAGISVDITEKKQAEENLQASKSRYKSIYNNIRDIYFESNFDGKIIEISPSIEKLSKYKVKEVLGSKIDRFYKNYNDHERLVHVLLNHDEVDDFEITLLDKNNDEIDCSISALLVKDSFNVPIKISGTIRDISERKKSERILKESEERYKSLNNFTPNPIMVIKEKKIKYVNPSALKLFEVNTENELINNSVLQYLHPDDIEKVNELINTNVYRNTGEPVELRIRRPKGETVYMLSAFITIIYDEEPAILMVSQDISRQKQYEIELIEAKAKAEESDRLKSAFLANMSHEIRTPLNGIIGFAGLLKRNGLTKQKYAQYAQIINSSSQQLLAIINDIIDISKIEAGQMTMNYDVSNINQVIDDLHGLYKTLAERKNVNFNSFKGLVNEKALIITDEIKLKQILNNLLNNALKFTSEGSIELGYNLNGEFLEFYVEDSGIGIPKEYQNIIFQRFRQVELADNKKFGGTGLGLSISKALVEMLEGNITVDSIIGKGTTFKFNIPYKIAIPEEINTEENHDNVKFNWQNKTVLIAEDEDANMFYIQEMLSETGANVLTAENGKKAVDLFISHPEINIVLMDIKMPGMDGYEALKIIKKHRPAIKIVAQTAYAMTNDRKQVLESGFDDYLSKPIERSDFFRVINNFFQE
jgi:PAS domain S-box-containing protein